MRRQHAGQSARCAETWASSSSVSWPRDSARSASSPGWFKGASVMTSLSGYGGRPNDNAASHERIAERTENLTEVGGGGSSSPCPHPVAGRYGLAIEPAEDQRAIQVRQVLPGSRFADFGTEQQALPGVV